MRNTTPLPVLRSIAMTLYHGFITDSLLARVIQTDPSCRVLVRFGGWREVVRAADVEALIARREAEGDYLRDVSFPATDYHTGGAERAS